jgi:hypothetical protein
MARRILALPSSLELRRALQSLPTIGRENVLDVAQRRDHPPHLATRDTAREETRHAPNRVTAFGVDHRNFVSEYRIENRAGLYPRAMWRALLAARTPEFPGIRATAIGAIRSVNLNISRCATRMLLELQLSRQLLSSR